MRARWRITKRFADEILRSLEISSVLSPSTSRSRNTLAMRGDSADRPRLSALQNSFCSTRLLGSLGHSFGAVRSDFQFPFRSKARASSRASSSTDSLPKDTYPGQTEALDTVGVQIVLAGPAPSQRAGPLAGGPVAALHLQAPPLSVEEANALAQAIGIPEPPDPLVPSVWLRALVQDSTADGATWGQNILDTTLNVAVIAFLVWVGMMIIRRPGP